MNKKPSIKPIISDLFINTENCFGHLFLLDFINNSHKYIDEINFDIKVDKIVLDRILKNSFHFQKYQWFSWKLFVIEICKIIGSGKTNKSSLQKMKSLIEYKCLQDGEPYFPLLKSIESFFLDNRDIIERLIKIRNRSYAHSDFDQEKIELPLIKECFELCDNVKLLFKQIGQIENSEYFFRDFSGFFRRFDEIKNHYISITNPTNIIDRAYLIHIVGKEYLIKIGMID